MKIIANHNIRSQKVKFWFQIRKEAQELREFIKAPKGSFEGHYQSAYAISHMQVSETPMNFFVLNENIEDGKLIKIFKSWCIVNATIIEEDDAVSYKEACMSFPYLKEKRTERFNKIRVRYYVPFLGIMLIRKTRVFENLPAFIIQHERDHGLGVNIYGRVKNN